MNRAKAIFVTLYLSLCAAYAVAAFWILASASTWAWIGVLGATLPILNLTLGNLLLHHSATTSRWLPIPSGLLLVGTVAGLLPGLAGAGSVGLWVAFGILDAGYLAYLLWYSRFASRTESRIRRGSPLPEFGAIDHHGKVVSSRDLVGSPALLVFYRGN